MVAMETVPAGWCGETSIAWLLGPAVARSQTALGPFGTPGATAAPCTHFQTPKQPSLDQPSTSPRPALDRQSLLWGDETWGAFTVLQCPYSTARLDLTALGWIPLTYSLPDPG